MKRSVKFLFAVAIAAAAAMAYAGEAIVSGYHSVCRAAAKLFKIDSLPIVAKVVDAELKPSVGLVRSVAFKLRMFQRQRPFVTPDWRMCPSV